MSALTEARDALRTVYNKPWSDITKPELDDAAFAALKVLDRVLEGEQVQWCSNEEHHHVLMFQDDCSIVPVRIIREGVSGR